MKNGDKQNTGTGTNSGNRSQSDVQVSRQGNNNGEKGTSAGMPSLFNSFFGDDLPGLFNFDLPSFGRVSRNLPAVNIRERKDDFVIDVAVPGMTKDNFDISVDNNVLHISAEANLRRSDEEENYTRREFIQSSFSRYFTLPDSVDPDKIDAKYTDGVLCLTLPKKEEARSRPPKRIQIS